jgi:hypothetical protein
MRNSSIARVLPPNPEQWATMGHKQAQRAKDQGQYLYEIQRHA